MSPTHSHAAANPSRRHWLKRSGLLAGSAMTAGALGGLFAPARSAHAADYKALVCIFLYGGNDGMNMVVPTDNDRNAQYRTVRGGIALPQASLSALAGSSFGLHPAMAALQTAWQDKRMAPVFNVGPLAAPLTKAAYRAAGANSPLVPSSLFSHADQQVLWETGTSSSLTRTGWGGRAVDVLATTNPVISVASNGRFGVSSVGMPLVVPEPGTAFGAVELGTESWRLQQPQTVARANALRAMATQAQDNDLTQAYARMQGDAFATSARLGSLVQAQPGSAAAVSAVDAAFAPIISYGQVNTVLGRQLYQIAKMVAGNATVQGNRQIFFAQLGGFDTHAGQVNSGDTVNGAHAGLLKQLADALAAFDRAMKNLGLADAVTAFTQSDFGRTFKPNSNFGTDHAWGNHQLVIGGAVKGGATYGTYPELVLGGSDDVGLGASELHGRWIPTTSVDQYAATLLSWFGAGDAQLDQILPNLANFGEARKLAFL